MLIKDIYLLNKMLKTELSKVNDKDILILKKRIQKELMLLDLNKENKLKFDNDILFKYPYCDKITLSEKIEIFLVQEDFTIHKTNDIKQPFLLKLKNENKSFIIKMGNSEILVNPKKQKIECLIKKESGIFVNKLIAKNSKNKSIFDKDRKLEKIRVYDSKTEGFFEILNINSFKNLFVFNNEKKCIGYGIADLRTNMRMFYRFEYTYEILYKNNEIKSYYKKNSSLGKETNRIGWLSNYIEKQFPEKQYSFKCKMPLYKIVKSESDLDLAFKLAILNNIT